MLDLLIVDELRHVVRGPQCLCAANVPIILQASIPDAYPSTLTCEYLVQVLRRTFMLETPKVWDSVVVVHPTTQHNKLILANGSQPCNHDAPFGTVMTCCSLLLNVSSPQGYLLIQACDCIVFSVGGNLLHGSWTRQSLSSSLKWVCKRSCLVHRRYSHEVRRDLRQRIVSNCGCPAVSSNRINSSTRFELHHRCKSHPHPRAPKVCSEIPRETTSVG